MILYEVSLTHKHRADRNLWVTVTAQNGIEARRIAEAMYNMDEYEIRGVYQK